MGGQIEDVGVECFGEATVCVVCLGKTMNC